MAATADAAVPRSHIIFMDHDARERLRALRPDTAAPVAVRDATGRVLDDGDAVHVRLSPHPPVCAPASDAAHVIVGVVAPSEDVQAHVRQLYDAHNDAQLSAQLARATTGAAAAATHDAPWLAIVVYAYDPDTESERTAGLLVRDGAAPWSGLVGFLPSAERLFSRNQGLLEVGALSRKQVAIIGVGSGGATVALELAKSGVGHFVLVDDDRLELHNVCRHACGLSSVGRYKTKAVRDALLDKNPHVQVRTFEVDIATWRTDRKLQQALSESHLLVGGTDNLRSRYEVNNISLEQGICAVYGRARTRACGGDVLVVHPHKTACVQCCFGQLGSEEISNARRVEEMMPEYAKDPKLAASQVQVGLSSDILPISTMMVKVILVELSRDADQETGISSLRTDLASNFFMWVNRRDLDFAGFPPAGFARFDQPSVLRWYPTQCERRPDCGMCGAAYAQADGADFFAATS